MTAQESPRIGAAFSWPPDSDKFRLLAGVLLAFSGLYSLFYLAVGIGRGWRAGFGDSFALWMWGRFAIEHPAAQIYDPALLRGAQLALGMDPGGSYGFAYPPSYLLVLWPLAHLSGWAVLVALMAISLPLYLWATLGNDLRLPSLAMALLAPATVIAVISGQSAFLVAALLVGGVRLLPVRPIAAGVLFGLLTVKPQLGLLLPVALVAARCWRSVVAAATTGIALIAVTSLLFGADAWLAWASSIAGFSRYVAADSAEVRHLMPTVLAALTQLGVAPPLAQFVQSGATVVAGAAVWWLYRRDTGRLSAAGLLVAALLATPYAFVYDMPILTAAVIWLVAVRRRAGGAFGTGEVLVIVLAMLSPAVLAAGQTRFPLEVLSLMLLLGMVCRRASQLRTDAVLAAPVAAAGG